MNQVIPGPFVAEWGNFPGKIDRVTTCEWVPAGNISVELYYEDPTNKMTIRLTNPLTPETERTTHLWFTWSRNFGDDDASYAEKFQKQSMMVQARTSACSRSSRRWSTGAVGCRRSRSAPMPR